MGDLVDEAPDVVLAIYAHPDDPEVAAGGTLARWAAAGTAVHVCICADGDKGSLDPHLDPAELAARRRDEAVEAGRILGVAAHHWLGFGDGDLENGAELRGRLVELIRSVRPSVVMAPDPTAVFFGGTYVNHRDHRATGWAVIDAAAPAAANPHYFPDKGPAHKVEALFLSGTLDADSWVDVSETIDLKAAAIACHASQLGEAGEWLRGAVRSRAEEAGREAAVAFAEGFRRIVLP
ncbi:MAG TPA: PIG-L deacetylase family protein [Acidimicrobiales bacterium]|nr:PIG-L deacetylase family protein [Acidimicrobiales bacterium]